MATTNRSTSETEEYRVQEECPKKRYVRYDIIIGQDDLGKVYKGFDTKDGIEIGWCKIEMERAGLALSNQKINAAYQLQTLNHENLVKCYQSWDESRKFFNIITDTSTPGNLRDYIKKHPRIGITVLKNWCRQILKALRYLHNHDPPIIHHDVKIENVSIEGESSTVKLGYFGYAFPFKLGKMLDLYPFKSQTMAPDIYEAEYNEKIDIYSFGMTVLQLLSKDGRNPAALHNVEDPEFRTFIAICTLPKSERPSAIELLNSSFLEEDVSETTAEGGIDSIQSLKNCGQDMASRLRYAIKKKGPMLPKKSRSTWSSESSTNAPLRIN